jgi:ribosomal protein L37AE/L43A
MLTFDSLRRCPQCKSADVISRGDNTLTMPWECCQCGAIFNDPAAESRWEPTAREISDAVVRTLQDDSGCNDGE